MTNNENIISQGWVCPKCGHVYSPTTDMCRYCGQYEITTNLPTMRDFRTRMDELEQTLK